MSLERELKEAFMRHSSDVEPREDAWTGVERSVRRAHARRVGFVSGAVAVVIAAAALVVPKLVSERAVPDRGFTNPSASAEPSTPAGIDTSDWVARAGVQSSFALKLPKDWKGGWFEGYWDFEPKSLPGLAEGGDTFAVEVNLIGEAYDRGSFGSGALWQPATVNGRNAKRRERPHVSGANTIAYRIDWTGACPAGARCVDADPATLEVKVTGSTAALWDRYVETGEQVVQTLELYDGSKPAHGVIAAGIPDGPATRALVRFLDARVEGIGADELMTDAASGQYAKRENDGGLYQEAVGNNYKAWTIDARREVDGNSVEFDVTIGSIHETIGVGPGKDIAGNNMPALVRFTQKI